MNISYQTPICPKHRKWGLVFTMVIYLILSGFSIFEIVHLSPIIPNHVLATAMVVVFVVCVLFPIYLAHIHKNLNFGLLRIAFEALPIVILVTLILFSCYFKVDYPTGVMIFATLVAELLSALILSIYTKLLYSKVKKVKNKGTVIKRMAKYP